MRSSDRPVRSCPPLCRAWKTDKSARVRFGRGESERSLRDLARRMLAAFRESPHAQPGGTILAIEEEFRAPVIPDCPDLFGRIDLVTVERAALRITDYKTARSRWSSANIQESAPQLLLYAELDPAKNLVAFGVWGYSGGGPAEDRTYLDDVAIIPEPGSLLLLALGGLAAIRRRS